MLKERGLPIQDKAVRRDDEGQSSLEFTTWATPGGKLGGANVIGPERPGDAIGRPSDQTDSPGQWPAQTRPAIGRPKPFTRPMAE